MATNKDKNPATGQNPNEDHIQKGRTDIGEGGTGGGMGSVGQQSDDAELEDSDQEPIGDEDEAPAAPEK